MNRTHLEQDGWQEEPMGCEACESMCLDAADGLLGPDEQASFEGHLLSCSGCAEQFAEAQRGAAWMDMLRTHRPEPSPALLANILARTSGAVGEEEATEVVPSPGPVPARVFPVFPVPSPAIPLPAIVSSPAVAGGGRLLAFPKRFFSSAAFNHPLYAAQSRLALTAAMALFSVALTMNLTGTHPGDLRPSALRRTVADAGAQAARSIQGLRVVYQVEAKVSELRDDASEEGLDRHEGEPSQTSAPTEKPARRSRNQPSEREKPVAPNGSSDLRVPALPARTPALHMAAEPVATHVNERREKGA